ncbi:amidohydrolase family protein [Streptomyces rochei]|uniref:amidohydrolase family protein n=1 Tax=Streptomyces rochei TaxID=1928 RepID=UPI003F4B2C5C
MALEGYTSHSARSVGEQDLAGRIAPGYRADLTAFAVDPVRLTMTGGAVVHRT